jgi:hypothetical protein
MRHDSDETWLRWDMTLVSWCTRLVSHPTVRLDYCLVVNTIHVWYEHHTCVTWVWYELTTPLDYCRVLVYNKTGLLLIQTIEFVWVCQHLCSETQLQVFWTSSEVAGVQRPQALQQLWQDDWHGQTRREGAGLHLLLHVWYAGVDTCVCVCVCIYIHATVQIAGLTVLFPLWYAGTSGGEGLGQFEVEDCANMWRWHKLCDVYDLCHQWPVSEYNAGCPRREHRMCIPAEALFVCAQRVLWKRKG